MTPVAVSGKKSGEKWGRILHTRARACPEKTQTLMGAHAWKKFFHTFHRKHAPLTPPGVSFVSLGAGGFRSSLSTDDPSPGVASNSSSNSNDRTAILSLPWLAC